MILQDEYWFDVVPSHGHSNEIIAGKWLHFGPTTELHGWLDQLDRLVEEGRIAGAKVARKLPGRDPFPDKQCVMCIFTSDDGTSKTRARDVVKKAFGIDVAVWKSEEQTRRDWLPDGWLQIESEINSLQQRIERDGLAERDKVELEQLSEKLAKNIAEVSESSGRSEIALNYAAKLASQLQSDTRSHNVTVPSIRARLDEMQETLHELLSANEKLRPVEAASALELGAQDQVFVIMPISTAHIDTYDTIRRAVSNVREGLRAWRVDEKPGAIQITDEIRKGIRTAGLVICDLTEERPNVYYELGLAHGLNKTVICIARKGTTIHLDVYGFKVLFFDNYRSLQEQLVSDIREILKEKERQGKQGSLA